MERYAQVNKPIEFIYICIPTLICNTLKVCDTVILSIILLSGIRRFA